MIRRTNRFLRYFRRGTVIAVKSQRGISGIGHVLDADDHGIYLDEHDGSPATFYAWDGLCAWNGARAVDALEARKLLHAETPRLMDELREMLHRRRCEGDSRPALSPDEIEEMLRKATTAERPDDDGR